MRRMMLLALALMLWALPAWAEEPAGYEALVGDWMPTVVIWDYEGRDTYGLVDWSEETVCVITADGQMYSNYLEIPISPLLYDEAAGQWYVQDDRNSSRISLQLDRYGSLVISSPNYWTVVLLRPDAVSAELPPMENCLSYDGTWELTGLYFYGDCMSPDMIAPDFMVEPASLGLPALTVTLGFSPDKDALYQAVSEAIDQHAPGTFLAMLQIYYGVNGYELCNSDTLLVHSSGFTLVMTRTETPEVDEALRPYVQQLAGWWLPDGVTVGGIPVALGMGDTLHPVDGPITVDMSDTLDFDDISLAFDEAGNALLGDKAATLTLADGTLMLDGMPLTIDGGGLTLEAAEGVMLHFVTEADWYRAQLNGEWRLEWIDVPSMDAKIFAADGGVSALLTIDADEQAVLRHDGGEMRFTVQSTDSVTDYQLIGEDGDERLLSIVSLDELCICITGGSGAYTYTFVPAE